MREREREKERKREREREKDVIVTSSGFASNLKLKSMLVGIRIRFRKTENFFTFQKIRLPPDHGLVLPVVLLTPKPRQNRQVGR